MGFHESDAPRRKRSKELMHFWCWYWLIKFKFGCSTKKKTFNPFTIRLRSSMHNVHCIVFFVKPVKSSSVRCCYSINISHLFTFTAFPYGCGLRLDHMMHLFLIRSLFRCLNDPASFGYFRSINNMPQKVHIISAFKPFSPCLLHGDDEKC